MMKTKIKKIILYWGISILLIVAWASLYSELTKQSELYVSDDAFLEEWSSRFFWKKLYWKFRYRTYYNTCKRMGWNFSQSENYKPTAYCYTDTKFNVYEINPILCNRLKWYYNTNSKTVKSNIISKCMSKIKYFTVRTDKKDTCDQIDWFYSWTKKQIHQDCYTVDKVFRQKINKSICENVQWLISTSAVSSRYTWCYTKETLAQNLYSRRWDDWYDKYWYEKIEENEEGVEDVIIGDDYIDDEDLYEESEKDEEDDSDLGGIDESQFGTDSSAQQTSQEEYELEDDDLEEDYQLYEEDDEFEEEYQWDQDSSTNLDNISCENLDDFWEIEDLTDDEINEYFDFVDECDEEEE